MALDLEVIPNQAGHLLAPGIYRLTLKVGAANKRVETTRLRLEYDGLWPHNESDVVRSVKLKVERSPFWGRVFFWRR